MPLPTPVNASEPDRAATVGAGVDCWGVVVTAVVDVGGRVVDVVVVVVTVV